MAQKRSTKMSDAHKEALAAGRVEGRAVRKYLEALAANQPKRGRKRTKESVQKRLDAIDTQLSSADPMKRLQLVQEQIDLKAELEAFDQTVDVSQLESDFVLAAGPYAERKGLGYAAFRAVGVPAAVLAKAGIKRGS